MKHITIIMLLAILFGSCNSQSQPAEAAAGEHNVKAHAEKMGQLLLKKDYKEFIKYNHPKIVEMMGGAEAMTRNLEKEMEAMNSNGTSFMSLMIGEPSPVVKAGDELQCTVPQTLEMKVPDGKLIVRSTLVGISPDNGKTWYFFDPSGQEQAEIDRMFPNLSSELVIPPASEPEYIKEP